MARGLARRTVLGALALPWLAGCSTPLPLVAAPPADADAARRLARAPMRTAWRATGSSTTSTSRMTASGGR